MFTLVRLKGKSLKGKNRVREHGEVWKIMSVADGSSPWIKKGELLVAPAEHPKWAYARWVDPLNDEHVTVEYI